MSRFCGAEPASAPHWPSMKYKQLLILTCSPRRGNGEAIAERLAWRALARGALGKLLYLRRYRVLPCEGCGYCAGSGAGVPRIEGETIEPTRGACVFDSRDKGRYVLQQLQQAPGLVLVAPVYFYGVPAQLKALIDRSQAIWEAQGGLAETRRPAYVVLTAGRVEGQKLFEGSLLTLRCFFRVMGFELQDTLLLRGLEGPESAAASVEVQETVTRWSREQLDW